MSRTRKKPYSGSKRFDHTCRNHGSCGYCKDTRTYQDRKVREAADSKLNAWPCHYKPEDYREGK